MLNGIREFASVWGDTASMFGLTLALIGIGITIFGVWRSKRAAVQARVAVESAVEQMAKFDVVAELNATLAVIEEVKRLQRVQAWQILPDRYAEIRRRLVSVKNSGSDVTDAYRESIQGSVEKLSRSERRVEQALAKGGTPPDPAKLNAILSAQFDVLHAVLLQMRHEYEKTNDRIT